MHPICILQVNSTIVKSVTNQDFELRLKLCKDTKETLDYILNYKITISNLSKNKGMVPAVTCIVVGLSQTCCPPS